MREHSTNNHRRRAKHFGVAYEAIKNGVVIETKGLDYGICGFPNVSPEDDTTCSVDGCDKKVCAKGICRAHYSKARRNAVPKGLPFTVYQWEWDDPRIRSILQARLDTENTVRIGARQCTPASVSVPESRAFLNEHHLQGYVNAGVRYGLYHDEKLVALMTFGPPREQKQADPVEWELIRFCVKKHHLVPGGASRLFSRFVADHAPASIVSYSDVAKTSGDMYPMLGFEPTNTSAPGYVWWNGKEALSRHRCMAHKLKARYPHLPGVHDMSETQIMEKLGYRKVKNLGNKVWVWRRPASAAA